MFGLTKSKAKAPEPAPSNGTVLWGMEALPISEATSHFLVAGTTGSGKTLTIRLLMQSVFCLERRALIYDAKRDVISFLTKINGGLPWKTLNPFDGRCCAWDIAADVDSPAAALQVATILMPAKDNETQPFFRDGARHLLYGVLRGLNAKAAGKWTLRQVLLILRNRERLLRVLEQTHSGADIAAIYAENERVFADLMSTALTQLLPLEIVAALWEGRKERVSLAKWLESDEILILGQHPAFRSSISPINQAIFRRASDLILSLSETKTRRTWIFLDEAREAGQLDGLAALLSQGRSKGACVVLGFQDIEGMRAVFGEKEAHEIVGMCNNKTFLRTDSHMTAKWVEEHFGKSLRYEKRVARNAGTSHSSGSMTTTSGIGIHYERVVDDAVWASEIMSWPKTSREHGMRGIHDVPVFGAWYPTHVSLDAVLDRLPREDPDPAKDAHLNEHFRAAANQQELAPWTEQDASALAIHTRPQPAPKVPDPLTREANGDGINSVGGQARAYG